MARVTPPQPLLVIKFPGTDSPRQDTFGGVHPKFHRFQRPKLLGPRRQRIQCVTQPAQQPEQLLWNPPNIRGFCFAAHSVVVARHQRSIDHSATTA